MSQSILASDLQKLIPHIAKPLALGEGLHDISTNSCFTLFAYLILQYSGDTELIG